MNDLWRLISILLSLTGFAVTGGVLLVQGESLPVLIVKAILVFVVLYAAQSLMGAIYAAVIGPEYIPDVSGKPSSETGETTLL